MKLLCSWTIENYLDLLSMLLVSIGGFFALIQWVSSKKLKRAEFIGQILNKIRFDKDMAATAYIIDYDQNWYIRDFHNDRDFEYKIDKYLSYTDYICYLYETKNITTDEFKVLKYRVNRTCINHSVQKYLWNLYHFAEKNNADCSFVYLIKYGIKNNLLKVGFKENGINLFPKYLNF